MKYKSTVAHPKNVNDFLDKWAKEGWEHYFALFIPRLGVMLFFRRP